MIDHSTISRVKELSPPMVAELTGRGVHVIRDAMTRGDARRKSGTPPTADELISWPKQSGKRREHLVTNLVEVEAWQERRRTVGAKKGGHPAARPMNADEFLKTLSW